MDMAFLPQYGRFAGRTMLQPIRKNPPDIAAPVKYQGPMNQSAGSYHISMAI
jgi:hypothetical protein